MIFRAFELMGNEHLGVRYAISKLAVLAARQLVLKAYPGDALATSLKEILKLFKVQFDISKISLDNATQQQVE